MPSKIVADSLEDEPVSSEMFMMSDIFPYYFRHTACVTCADRTVCILNLIGQKVFPCLVLSSKASMLEVSGHFVMVVTCKGAVYVWNVQKKKCVVKNEQLSAIMKGETVIYNFYLIHSALPT